MEANLGTTEVDLDGRFLIVRTQESNLGGEVMIFVIFEF